MHKEILLVSFLKKIPSLYSKKLMSSIVRYNYNHNEYNQVYRLASNLTLFEKESIDFFLDLLDESPKILDIGCGSGSPFDIYLYGKGAVITGLDISEKQISLAQNNLPLAEFLRTDVLKYETDEKYDGIIMLYSLFHIKRDSHKEVINKIYNMLNENGCVLMNVRKEDNSLKYKKNFCAKPMLWSNYSWKDFRKILKEEGFTYCVLDDEKKHGSKESHLWIILKK